MNNKWKYLLYFLLLILLVAPFYAVLNQTDLGFYFSNSILTVSLLQRLTGLYALVFLFIQLVLGNLNQTLIQIFGAKAYKYHITFGIFTALFAFLHPITQMVLDYQIRGVFGALLTLLPGVDFYLNMGKLAFMILIFSSLTGYFRTHPLFRKKWKAIHNLNYFLFFFASYHAWHLGTDVRIFPFSFLFLTMVGFVSILVLRKFVLYTKHNIFAKIN